jgi:hypothetical protein
MLQRTQVTISFNDQTLEAPETTCHAPCEHGGNGSQKSLAATSSHRTNFPPAFEPPDGNDSSSRNALQECPSRMPFKYPTALLSGLKQATFKCLVRTIIHKQILPVIATVDDMIHSIGSFNS